jgi:hypothetical protein
MISSWRGVGAAGAVAAVLAIAVVVDLGRAPAGADRSLVAGFDPERVTELVWERPGQPAIHVVRGGGAWQIRAPSSAPADPSAISDVLAALRGARWHRRGDPAPVHTTLTIVAGTERRVLGIAAPLSGTDQSWIVDGNRGLVVDSWVARALDRDLLALRIAAPLADVRRAQTIVVESAAQSDGAQANRGALRIEGRPRRLVRPVALLLAPQPIDDLERALAELTIVRLSVRPVRVQGLAITIAGADPGAPTAITVEIGGSCPGAPGLVAVSGTAGDGCIERPAATAIEQAIARLRNPPEALVEQRPIPFEPQRIALVDGIALETSPLRLGDHPADPARVAEILAALAAPAEVTALPAKPAAQHLVVTDHAGSATTLDLFGERVVARHGEPVALRPGPGAWRLLMRSSRELRDLTLWLEEPTTITSLRVDNVTYQRGAVIGAWDRRPAGSIDARAVEALVAMLAAPRALGFIDDDPAIAHRVTIVVTPPVGPSSEHVLELGTLRAAGCPARVASDTIALPAIVCAQIAALAR